MNNNDITGFVIDCLTDPGNRDKQAALNKWLQESEENRHLYAELKQLWEAAAGVPPMPFNVQEGWQELSQQITPPAQVRRISSWKIAAAAAILLLLAAGGWWRQMSATAGEVTYTARAVEKDSLQLPDGTLVYMKSGATLKYNRQFKDRTVKLLKGEAYFTVVKDPEHQFAVVANKSVVKVLGTAFNVRIDTTYTEVIVWEGKVSLNNDDHQLILTAGKGNLGMADVKTGHMKKLRGDYSNRCTWATDELVFENEEAQHVADVMAEYYRQPVMNVAENLRHKRITVRFRNTSYEEAAEIFSMLLDQ